MLHFQENNDKNLNDPKTGFIFFMHIYQCRSEEILPDVLQVESDGQLEVQLDRGTLVLSAESVTDLDIDLNGS